MLAAVQEEGTVKKLRISPELDVVRPGEVILSAG